MNSYEAEARRLARFFRHGHSGGKMEVAESRAPSGLGQVLENRNVLSNLLSESFDVMKVARLGGFVNLERSTLQEFSLKRGEDANIVFLTPGFHHPSYFEHAYKARLLGFVETWWLGQADVRRRVMDQLNRFDEVLEVSARSLVQVTPSRLPVPSMTSPHCEVSLSVPEISAWKSPWM